MFVKNLLTFIKLSTISFKRVIRKIALFNIIINKFIFNG